jgi:hypothetical protein
MKRCKKPVAVADAMNTAHTRPASDADAERRQKPLSMHDDVQVWDDCCSCEAEPYWLEAMHKSEGESSDDEPENS